MKATPGQINYWTRRVKAAGFKVDTSIREIDPYPYDSFKAIPVGPRYYVEQLIKQGYNVQHKIR